MNSALRWTIPIDVAGVLPAEFPSMASKNAGLTAEVLHGRDDEDARAQP
jgi:hypothetical protein